MTLVESLLFIIALFSGICAAFLYLIFNAIYRLALKWAEEKDKENRSE